MLLSVTTMAITVSLLPIIPDKSFLVVFVGIPALATCGGLWRSANRSPLCSESMTVTDMRCAEQHPPETALAREEPATCVDRNCLDICLDSL